MAPSSMAPANARSTHTPTRQPIVPVQAPRKIRRRRKALTLIEMLVSVTLTLLVVFAIVQVFEFLGDSVSLGRATIEMAGQMRSAAHRLQLDLDNRTCPVKPWVDPGSGLGYFEIIDGQARDNSPGEPLGVGIQALPGLIYRDLKSQLLAGAFKFRPNVQFGIALAFTRGIGADTQRGDGIQTRAPHAPAVLHDLLILQPLLIGKPPDVRLVCRIACLRFNAFKGHALSGLSTGGGCKQGQR